MANASYEVSITTKPESRALIERFTVAAEALAAVADRAPEHPEIREAASSLLDLADAPHFDEAGS